MSFAAPSSVAEDSAAAVGQRAAAADVPAVAASLVAFALLCGIAAPMLRWWYWEYTRPESYYGHAFLVPTLIALMLWHRRDALR